MHTDCNPSPKNPFRELIGKQHIFMTLGWYSTTLPWQTDKKSKNGKTRQNLWCLVRSSPRRKLNSSYSFLLPLLGTIQQMENGYVAVQSVSALRAEGRRMSQPKCHRFGEEESPDWFTARKNATNAYRLGIFLGWHVSLPSRRRRRRRGSERRKAIGEITADPVRHGESAIIPRRDHILFRLQWELFHCGETERIEYSAGDIGLIVLVLKIDVKLKKKAIEIGFS